MKRLLLPAIILLAVLLTGCHSAPPSVSVSVSQAAPAASEPVSTPADILPPADTSTSEAPSSLDLSPDQGSVPDPGVKEEPAPLPEEVPVLEPTVSWVQHETVPILMYHEVNDQLSNSLFLSVADFTAHLAYFEQAGITPISMQQLYEHWTDQAPLPEKPIVLTFDDGYRSMYTTVYPLLKERGWSGTFFCITNTTKADGHLSTDMIAEMAANGMEIGSHTVSHLDLSACTDTKLSAELTNSKSTLSSVTGKEVSMLCYPSGRYNAETMTVAGASGYLCAVTTKNALASRSQDLLELSRIRVSQGYGVNWLKKVLAPLGY